MVGIIYKITNLLNFKIYIGSDTKNNGYGDPNYFGSGLLIKKSLEKYGKENFSKEILCECHDLEDLKNKESYFIKKYKSNQREIGYNISDGYWGGDTLKNHPDIEGIRKKISEGTNKNIEKMKDSRKKFYSRETEEEKRIRIEKIKEASEKMDRSFYKSPDYLKKLSEGLKESKIFIDYNERRKGSKRGKYITKKEDYINSRIEKIKDIESNDMKKILTSIVDRDHSTFHCYLKVYLHIEGKEKINELEKFLNFVDSKMSSENEIDLVEIRKEYDKIGIRNLKIGKCMTILKSIYNFDKKNHLTLKNPIKLI